MGIWKRNRLSSQTILQSMSVNPNRIHLLCRVVLSFQVHSIQGILADATQLRMALQTLIHAICLVMRYLMPIRATITLGSTSVWRELKMDSHWPSTLKAWPPKASSTRWGSDPSTGSAPTPWSGSESRGHSLGIMRATSRLILRTRSVTSIRRLIQHTSLGPILTHLNSPSSTLKS